jgi:hypothetical protein
VESGGVKKGDIYKRRKISADKYQCGCKWVRRAGLGDVLVECPIHKAATEAFVKRVK